ATVRATAANRSAAAGRGAAAVPASSGAGSTGSGPVVRTGRSTGRAVGGRPSEPAGAAVPPRRRRARSPATVHTPASTPSQRNPRSLFIPTSGDQSCQAGDGGESRLRPLARAHRYGPAAVQRRARPGRLPLRAPGRIDVTVPVPPPSGP